MRINTSNKQMKKKDWEHTHTHTHTHTQVHVCIHPPTNTHRFSFLATYKWRRFVRKTYRYQIETEPTASRRCLSRRKSSSWFFFFFFSFFFFFFCGGGGFHQNIFFPHLLSVFFLFSFPLPMPPQGRLGFFSENKKKKNNSLLLVFVPAFIHPWLF